MHQTLHLFWSLQKKENISIHWKTVKGIWNSFLPKKDTKFSEDEIMKLSEKWQKIVEQNGEYIVQESS